MATNKNYSPVVSQAKVVHASQGTATLQGTEFGKTSDYGLGLKRVFHFQYSFANDGGAVGAILPLNGGAVQLPLNAVLIGGVISVTTAPTSGGSATVAIGTSAGSSASSLLAATAISSLTTGLHAIVPVFTAATAVKLTASGYLQITVTTAALTAGVIEGWIEFYVGVN
jgi:hypothetical protein